MACDEQRLDGPQKGIEQQLESTLVQHMMIWGERKKSKLMTSPRSKGRTCFLKAS